MAWMAIRVSGQRQKHGASLADKIAKWLLRFSGDPLPPPSYLHKYSRTRTLFCRHSPPPATAATVVVFVVAAITVIVPSAGAVAAVVLVLLPPPPPRLPLPLLAFS